MIELVGLTPEIIKQFVVKNVPEEKLQKVEESLLGDPVLMCVCDVPLWCSEVCTHLQGVSGEDTKTYTRLVAYLIWVSMSGYFIWELD